MKEKDYLDQILKQGSLKANEIASNKIEEIHKIVGF